MVKRKMSKKECQDWEELYYYVKDNVLGYDENQSLSKNMVLRLKGLLNNKYIANNNIEDSANYSYEVVLNTFKYSLPDIKRGFSRNSFVDENHRFNFALKIVESNLNTIYIRMKNAEKTKEKIESIDTSIHEYKGAEYKPKNKINDKFKDLW